MNHLFNLMAVLLSSIGLTACLGDINFTSYEIEYPESNATYIGTVQNPAPNENVNNTPLGEQFIIRYESPPSSPITIALNGNNIGDLFDFAPDQATVDIDVISQYFKQGKNTLTVSPLSLGPSVVFYLDDKGPEIIVTRGEIINPDPKTGIGSHVEIEGYLRDYSRLNDTIDLDLVLISGYDDRGNVNRTLDDTVTIAVDNEGKFCACNDTAVDIEGKIKRERWENKGDDRNTDWQLVEPGVSLLYAFHVTDTNGYEKTLEILGDSDGTGDSLAIKNALRLAVGDTFIESLRPVIAAGLYTMLEEAPIDQRKEDGSFDVINPLNVNIGLGNMPTSINRFYMANGREAIENPNEWKTINPGQGTMLLNGFKVKSNNRLAVDMVITSMLVDLTVELPKWVSWAVPNLDLGMYIKTILVETEAILSASVNEQTSMPKIAVQLGESNFSLQGIKMTKTKAGSLDITGLAGALMPILEGLIGGLLPSIVNPVLEQNLNKIVIGQRLYRTDLIPEDIDRENLPDPERRSLLSAEELAILNRLEATVPYTDIRLDVSELATGNLLGPNLPYDMLIGLQTKADTGKKDPGLNAVLGTVFNDDPIDPAKIYNSLGQSGTNISMAINSNLLNQVLTSVYSIGQMHLTSYKGTTYFGANKNIPYELTAPDTTTASKGDTRIRLWPEMPPLFEIKEIAGTEGTAKASITYPSAVLAMDRFDGENWLVDIEFQVDFNLAILVNENEGAVTLGAAGPPDFTINKMINHTPFQFPEVVIQGILDAVLYFGGDAFTDQLIALDLNTIAESAINGKQVTYLDANDRYQLEDGQCASFKVTNEETQEGIWGQCDIGDNNCDPALTPLTDSRGDGYDLICQNLSFVVQTDTVGVIGDEGRNLFFQMGARDPRLPAAPAIPRLDLDDDGVTDYRDNCSLGQQYLVEVIETAAISTGMTLIEATDAETGDVNPVFEEAVRLAANRLMAKNHSSNENENALPSAGDIVWYNKMRKGDNAITAEALGDYPWLKMLFSNQSQFNSDADRVGELCENDSDRDGIYADNAPLPIDNCPSVYNPLQEDTKHPIGVGDACNARATFVMLRSLKSAEANGTALCLVHEAEANEDGNGGPAFRPGTNWVSEDMHVMLPCDETDERQHFYMKAIDNDLSNGVEFYTDVSRNSETSSRLAAYGEHRRQKVCATGGHVTAVDKLRLVNSNDAVIKNENAQILDGGCISKREDRADPIWHPRRAENATTYEEISYPWYLDTRFDFHFAYKGNEENIGATCMTYAEGSGVELHSKGHTGHCGTGSNWRWAIWVGGTAAPWNGQW